MDAGEILWRIALGALLGAAGQGLRLVVGLKKEHDAAVVSGKKWEEWFSWPTLLSSLLIGVGVGALAGILGTIGFLDSTLTKEYFLLIIAAGYAGTDFIEGMMKRRLPAM